MIHAGTDFLTVEECAAVDRALLTSADKLTARVAIYALRSLKHIAQENQTTIESLTSAQIEDWIYQDNSLQTTLDREFKPFFCKLVVSSLQPLQQAATATGGAIADLTIVQLITWFEHQANQRANP